MFNNSPNPQNSPAKLQGWDRSLCRAGTGPCAALPGDSSTLKFLTWTSPSCAGPLEPVPSSALGLCEDFCHFCLLSSLFFPLLSASRSAYHRSPWLCFGKAPGICDSRGSLCFQQEPQHFPQALLGAFHGKFPFAGNSAPRKAVLRVLLPA